MPSTQNLRPAYQYIRLQYEREFRLVRFNSKSDAEVVSPVTCNFSHHSVDDAPKYSTLSYTWGGPGEQEKVECSGNTILNITANLATWLKLHGVRLAKEGNLLWIDQLCIDQSNVEERSAQVRIMCDIYRNAANLFVWIGPESNDSELALQTLAQAGKVLQDLYEHPRGAQISRDEYYAIGFPPPDQAAWGAVFRLFKRSWFHRVWVRQEIAKSNGREIMLQCGLTSIPWIWLEYTAYGIVHSQEDMNPRVSGDTILAALQGSQLHFVPTGLSAIADIGLFRESNQGSPRNLYVALRNFRGFEASDAKDNIFALVGMIKDGEDAILVPDYDRRVEEIFQSVTFLMLKRYGLDILGESGHHQKNIQHLPSWVVDWTFRPEGNTLLTYPRPLHYQATGSTNPVLTSPQYSSPLRLDGVFADVIKACTNPLNNSEAPGNTINPAIPPGLTNWYLAASRLAESLVTTPSEQPAPCSSEDRFWRTLVANRTYGGIPAPSSYASEHMIVREYLNLWDSCDRDMASFSADPRRIELQPAYDKSSFLVAWYKFSFQRSFCVTKHGRMGLVPGGSEAGDRVVVLLGGDLPFVVRENEKDKEEFVLIGDCYIDGITDGEALKGHHNNGKETTNIEEITII
jgi:Heterokaryon incompatibility protein (HET)